MILTERELGTVLAALRLWQHSIEHAIGQYDPNLIRKKGDLWEIATDIRRLKPLRPDEIDDLCTRINQ
jgi:hypothetical protein